MDVSTAYAPDTRFYGIKTAAIKMFESYADSILKTTGLKIKQELFDYEENFQLLEGTLRGLQLIATRLRQQGNASPVALVRKSSSKVDKTEEKSAVATIIAKINRNIGTEVRLNLKVLFKNGSAYVVCPKCGKNRKVTKRDKRFDVYSVTQHIKSCIQDELDVNDEDELTKLAAGEGKRLNSSSTVSLSTQLNKSNKALSPSVNEIDFQSPQSSAILNETIEEVTL